MHFPKPGELFEGRYRVERELGAGGFARVFLTRDEKYGRHAALKILLPEDEGYTLETRSRFRREVQIIASLTHPNTVTLYDSGESSDGALYMVFEYVPGEDLADLLERHGTLDGATVAEVLFQLLGALQEAHEHGLIHRDLKPQNVRVCSPPGAPIDVRLLDFGIARSTDDAAAITKTGQLIGTPRYMSPEQLTERPLTPRSDLYSLGMVAFELLVGSDALPGNRWGDQLDRLRTGHLFGTEFIDRVGPQLLSILQRMTARDPEHRPPSAAAVLKLFEASPAPPTSTVSADALETPPPSNRWIAGGFVLVLLLIVAIVGILLRGGEETASPAPPAQQEPRELTTSLLRPTQDAGDAPTPIHVADASPDLPVSLDLGPNASAGCTATFREHVREAEVIVPPDYNPATPHPAVVWLMADQDQAVRVPNSGPLQRLVETERVILIVPFGATKQRWRADQLGHIRRIVDDVRNNHCVATDRIFVMSTGGSGTLTSSLSCEPWVAAVAIDSFLGPADQLQRCGPTLWLTPKDSVHLPIEGGETCTMKLPPFLLKIFDVQGPAPAEAYELIKTRMRDLNGCSGKARSTKLPHATCQTWRCEIPFESCVTEGGIGWPGTEQSPVSIISSQSAPDVCPEPAPSLFDATTHAWEFFQRVTADKKSD